MSCCHCRNHLWLPESLPLSSGSTAYFSVQTDFSSTFNNSVPSVFQFITGFLFFYSIYISLTSVSCPGIFMHSVNEHLARKVSNEKILIQSLIINRVMKVMLNLHASGHFMLMIFH